MKGVILNFFLAKSTLVMNFFNETIPIEHIECRIGENKDDEGFLTLTGYKESVQLERPKMKCFTLLEPPDQSEIQKNQSNQNGKIDVDSLMSTMRIDIWFVSYDRQP